MSGLLAGLMIGSLGGCAGAFDAAPGVADAPVDSLIAEHRVYPRWEDFPSSPEGLPTAARLAEQVAALNDSGASLAGDVAQLEWTLSDPEAFAAAIIARINAADVSPDTVRTQAEVEAFAARLRERGRAPPPIDRH
ncbi:hypothetical protein [uncultured Brevundimonas sp.]|uniref:hypothetical protein n=1 Tax=uncultured Brevundimonas sp. TaxID=213418 RepID=UPI0030EDB78B